MNLIIVPFLFFMSANGKLRAWKAKESIELSSSQIALDGGSPNSLPCPHQTKTAVGKLEINSNFVELSCYDDYMGGFFHNEDNLAQKDGDAGESWETQSLLFYDKESKSLFLSLKTYSTYDTSIECDGYTKKDLKKSGWSNQKIADCLAGLVKCKKSEKFKKWDPSKQKFFEASFSGTAPKRQFKPFEKYLKSCK